MPDDFTLQEAPRVAPHIFATPPFRPGGFPKKQSRAIKKIFIFPASATHNPLLF
jgi:hypothetical protein